MLSGLGGWLRQLLRSRAANVGPQHGRDTGKDIFSCAILMKKPFSFGSFFGIMYLVKVLPSCGMTGGGHGRNFL